MSTSLLTQANISAIQKKIQQQKKLIERNRDQIKELAQKQSAIQAVIDNSSQTPAEEQRAAFSLLETKRLISDAEKQIAQFQKEILTLEDRIIKGSNGPEAEELKKERAMQASRQISEQEAVESSRIALETAKRAAAASASKAANESILKSLLAGVPGPNGSKSTIAPPPPTKANPAAAALPEKEEKISYISFVGKSKPGRRKRVREEEESEGGVSSTATATSSSSKKTKNELAELEKELGNAQTSFALVDEAIERNNKLLAEASEEYKDQAKHEKLPPINKTEMRQQAEQVFQGVMNSAQEYQVAAGRVLTLLEMKKNKDPTENEGVLLADLEIEENMRKIANIEEERADIDDRSAGASQKHVSLDMKQAELTRRNEELNQFKDDSTQITGDKSYYTSIDKEIEIAKTRMVERARQAFNVVIESIKTRLLDIESDQKQNEMDMQTVLQERRKEEASSRTSAETTAEGYDELAEQEAELKAEADILQTDKKILEVTLQSIESKGFGNPTLLPNLLSYALDYERAALEDEIDDRVELKEKQQEEEGGSSEDEGETKMKVSEKDDDDEAILGSASGLISLSASESTRQDLAIEKSDTKRLMELERTEDIDMSEETAEEGSTGPDSALLKNSKNIIGKPSSSAPAYLYKKALASSNLVKTKTTKIIGALATLSPYIYNSINDLAKSLQKGYNKRLSLYSYTSSEEGTDDNKFIPGLALVIQLPPDWNQTSKGKGSNKNKESLASDTFKEDTINPLLIADLFNSSPNSPPLFKLVLLDTEELLERLSETAPKLISLRELVASVDSKLYVGSTGITMPLSKYSLEFLLESGPLVYTEKQNPNRSFLVVNLDTSLLELVAEWQTDGKNFSRMLYQYRLYQGKKKRKEELSINFADRRTVPVLKNFISGLRHHYALFHLFSTRLDENDNKYQPATFEKSGTRRLPKPRGGQRQSNYVFIIIRYATTAILNALQKETPDANAKQQLRELFTKEQDYFLDARRNDLEAKGKPLVYVGDFPFIDPDPPLNVKPNVILQPFFYSAVSKEELGGLDTAVAKAYRALILPKSMTTRSGSSFSLLEETEDRSSDKPELSPGGVSVISVQKTTDSNMETKKFLFGDSSSNNNNKKKNRVLYQYNGYDMVNAPPTFVIDSSDYDDLIQGNVVNIKSIRQANGQVTKIQGDSKGIEDRKQEELRNLRNVDGFNPTPATEEEGQSINLVPEHYAVFVMPTKLFTSTILDFETTRVKKSKRRALDKLAQDVTDERFAELAQRVKEISRQLGRILDEIDSIEYVIETEVIGTQLVPSHVAGGEEESAAISKFSKETKVSFTKEFTKRLTASCLRKLRHMDITIERAKEQIEGFAQRYSDPYTAKVGIIEQSFNETVADRYAKIEESIEELKSKYVWLSGARALTDEEEAIRKSEPIEEVELSILNNSLTKFVSNMSEDLVYNLFETLVEYKANEAYDSIDDVSTFIINILRRDWSSARDDLKENKMLLNYYRKLVQLYNYDMVPDDLMESMEHANDLQKLSKQRLFSQFNTPDLQVTPFETWATGFNHQSLSNVFWPFEQMIDNISTGFREKLAGRTESLRQSLAELERTGTLSSLNLPNLNVRIAKLKTFKKTFDKLISEIADTLLNHIAVSHVMPDLIRDPSLLSLLCPEKGQKRPDFGSLMAKAKPIHEANDQVYQTMVQLGLDIVLAEFDASRRERKLTIAEEDEEEEEDKMIQEEEAESETSPGETASKAAIPPTESPSTTVAASEEDLMDTSSKFRNPTSQKTLSIRRPGKNQRRTPPGKR